MRFLTHMIGHRYSVPNLVVARQVIDRMVRAALTYAGDETGEALVGLFVPEKQAHDIATIYVLDTISPDDSTVRQAHMVEQGDDVQDELIWWLQENWHIYRQKRRGSYGSAQQAKWDVPLRYLGDWHRQPGYMIAPSSGDLMTALGWLDDPDHEADFLLAPILTLDHPPTTMIGEGMVNFVTAPQGDGLNARIDFWYIDRNARMFLPISPTVYPTDQLPRLTPYPWHLVDKSRFLEEEARLHADELFTTVVLWNATDRPPLEICFMAARMGAANVLLLITRRDYPASAPTARLAPFTPMGDGDDMVDVFEKMWAQSEVVAAPPGWQWSPDKYLIDYVHALEQSLGIAPERPTASADVNTDSAEAEPEDETEEGSRA